MPSTLQPHAGRDIDDLPAHVEELHELARLHAHDLTTLIQVLQSRFGFLPRNVLREVAACIDVPLSRLFGIATFYTSLHLAPRGRHILRVCHGTACHVAGAPAITDALSKELGIAPGETTEDRLFTLESVACVGCCSLAPVVAAGEEMHGRVQHRAVGEVVRAVVAAAQDHCEPGSAASPTPEAP